MFNLQDYIEDIYSMAKNTNTPVLQALDNFITNLTVMHEHFPGASQLNFHTLGQQWNSLLSKEKVEQKKNISKILASKHHIRRKRDIVERITHEHI